MLRITWILPIVCLGIFSLIVNVQAYPPDEVDIEVSTGKESYKQRDLLTIRGTGAHSYTVFIDIISPAGETIIELMTIAARNGEFTTPWILPATIENGEYIVQVRDYIKNATTTFYIGTPPIDSTEPSPELKSEIPEWIKNSAGWWADGQIGDSDFLQGIQYLIENGIMIIPETTSSAEPQEGIPEWIKNNAGWWSDGMINDLDFMGGIQYLIQNGIITIE